MCENSLGRNTCPQLRNMQLFSRLCLPLGAATPVNLRITVLPFPRHLRTQNLAQKLREVYVGVMSEHCFSHPFSFDLVCIPNHSCLKDLRVISLHKKWNKKTQSITTAKSPVELAPVALGTKHLAIAHPPLGRSCWKHNGKARCRLPTASSAGGHGHAHVSGSSSYSLDWPCF